MIGAVRDLGRRAGAGHTEAQVRCAPGSLLLLYTDGFTDVAGEDADERTDILERPWPGSRPACRPRKRLSASWRSASLESSATTSRCWSWASRARHSRTAAHRSA